jgi:hydrogenase expression/formation protein HypD
VSSRLDGQQVYSDRTVVRSLTGQLHDLCRDAPEMAFMEVCGTHTMAIFRQGIRALLPSNLRLVSGPGCPVCVTPTSYLDIALALARRGDVTIATFGDLVRVPGSYSSLERDKAAGCDVRIVYSPLDAVGLAAASAPKQVVFLGVGFETTTPAVAQSVLEADRLGLSGFRVLVAHRRVVPALEALLASPDLKLDGFLLPGHVSVILGSEAYRFLLRSGVSGVVTGFEPADILRALIRLVQAAREGQPVLENQYARLVSPEGNRLACEAMDRVFEPVDAEWRGLGILPRSGLALRADYARFDALGLLEATELRAIREAVRDESGCRCGEVLTGTVRPPECSFFGSDCTPETPVGPCMVSSEGTCAAYYKYGER